MATVINIRYEVDTKDLVKTNKIIKKTEKNTKKFANAAKNLKRIKTGFLSISVAAAGIFVAVDKALQKLDKIGKSAKNIGITAERLQELSFAAGQSGVSVDLFQKSMLKLSKNAIDANDGLTTAVRAFNRMGIESKELQGVLPDQLLELVAERFSKMKDPVEQAASAMAIFGTRGADMIEFLKKGKKGMNDLSQQARDLGIVFDNTLVEGAEKANDEFTIMKKIITVQWVSTWAKLAPQIITLSESLASFAGVITSVFTPDLTSSKGLSDQIRLVDDDITDLRKNAADLKKDLETQNQLGEGILPFSTSDEEDLKALEETNAKINEKLKQRLSLFVKHNKALAIEAGVKFKTDVDEPNKPIDESASKIKIKQAEDLASTILNIRKDLSDETRQLSIDATTNDKQRFDEQQQFELLKFERMLTNEKIFGEKRLLILEEFAMKQQEQELANISEREENNKTSIDRTTEFWADGQARMEDFAVSTTNKMADGLADMVTQGKLDFGSLAKSILDDLLKMIIQQQLFIALKAITGIGAADGAVIPAAKGGINLANGGRLTSGVERIGQFRTGERGQEAVLPLTRNSAGKLSVNATGGSQASSQPINLSSSVVINNPQGNGDDVALKSSRAIEKSLMKLIKRELVDARRPGNILNQGQTIQGNL